MKLKSASYISFTSSLKKPVHGFTIVELLIVIVVIAILAAITIVAFNGVQQRARISSVTSSLSQLSKKIQLYQVENPGAYPSTLAGIDLGGNAATTYQYRLTATGYCATATSGATSYFITEGVPAAEGSCVGHSAGGSALAQNLITNPSLEVNTSGWSLNTGATIARVVGGQGVITGNAALETNATTANASGSSVSVSGLSANTAYTYSVYLTPISGDYTNLILRVGDGSGTRAYASFNPALVSGQTLRRSITWTTSASPSPTSISIFRNGTSTGSAIFRVDAAMVELGSTATAYSE